MTKSEINKLVNTIKGYYNSQFFIDDFVLNAWYESLKDYDLEDAEEHLKDYLKNYPDTPPKPHTFKNGLYTHEEKETMRNQKYTIACNLCGRWMNLEEYDRHYDKCLDIQYLISVAKSKGHNLTREELENKRQDVIDGLLAKYPPTKLELEEAYKTI